jgi:hypothetical protein
MKSYGGEQLCFDYGPEYFPHLDMVPLSQTPQRNPEQVPPPVLSMEGLKRSGSLVKQVLLSPAAKPPSAVKSSPEVEDEDEDDNFEENMEEDGDSDLEEGEYKPPKQPAAAREVTAIGADRMGHVKKTPEKRSAPPPSRVVSSDGPAAAAAPARANNEAVLWRNGAVRVLNWGTSNFFIARVGDRDPYIFRAGLICLFSAKGIVARVHCIAENRWHITVEGCSFFFVVLFCFLLKEKKKITRKRRSCSRVSIHGKSVQKHWTGLERERVSDAEAKAARRSQETFWLRI